MSNLAPHRQIATLYSDHHGWLHAWLRKKLGCSHQAADLAQDTFLRVLSRKDDFELRQPRAYLTTIAHGLVVNHWRRQELERAYIDALACLPEPQAPSPEQKLLVLETLFQIDTLLSSLPPKVRRAFLLSQLDGMRYSDIAREIDVSEITVKRYMKQAFVQCLQLLE